uniref:Ycf54 n=1 Tax=Caloglossa intermedia TaxID=100879 RepID=A0A1Z1M5L3_9FLOR|nr:hypothetical protein [Caloglossa intermedia]ARW61367.1 hypothetical protein [Caloglossa intermedia]
MFDYYFILASQNFLLNEEPLEEVLRERFAYYQRIDKKIDFWFILNPEFIGNSSLDMKKLSPKNSYAAVVSLDKSFIQWLKLRIGFVIIGEFSSPSVFLPSS